ncbi:unnamed protein product [Amoebophrya sp. A120]|nr:unnamed protein product [Amoebophrya sp. A120]|eukprot:GSA120T00017769001.1
MRKAMQYLMTPAFQSGGSAGSSSTSGGRNNNVAGFAAEAPEYQGPYGQKNQADDAQAAKKQAAKERKQKYKELGKQNKDAKQEKEEKEGFGDAASYVDLAKKRREQEGELVKTMEKFSAISAAESKFMGGDADHTFWVKGLDENLLQQRRKELDREQRSAVTNDPDARIMEQRQRAKENLEKKQTSKSVLAQRVEAAFVKSLHPDQNGFRQHLKSMHTRLYKGDKVKSGPVTFLPKRTYYQFSTDLFDLEEKPVYGSRSKAECPDLDEKIKCEYVEKELLKHIKETMADFKQNKKLRKQGLLLPGTTTRVDDVRSLSGGGGTTGRGSTSEIREQRDRDTSRHGSSRHPHGSRRQHTTTSSRSNKPAADDSDDDIFGGGSAKSFKDLVKSTIAKPGAAASREQKPKQKDKLALLAEVQDERMFDKLEEGLDPFAGQENADDEFIPSRKYKGSKKGWIFTTRDGKTGYYFDYARLDTAQGLADRANERKKLAQERLARLTGKTASDEAYSEYKADDNVFQHTKETIAAQVKAEEEFEKLSEKKKKKLAAKMDQDTTDGAKFFMKSGNDGTMQEKGGEKKFKSVDDELKAIDKLKEKGSMKKFDAMEAAQPSAKRAKYF